MWVVAPDGMGVEGQRPSTAVWAYNLWVAVGASRGCGNELLFIVGCLRRSGRLGIGCCHACGMAHKQKHDEALALAPVHVGVRIVLLMLQSLQLSRMRRRRCRRGKVGSSGVCPKDR